MHDLVINPTKDLPIVGLRGVGHEQITRCVGVNSIVRGIEDARHSIRFRLRTI